VVSNSLYRFERGVTNFLHPSVIRRGFVEHEPRKLAFYVWVAALGCPACSGTQIALIDVGVSRDLFGG
jgi:hypothetical protein